MRLRRLLLAVVLCAPILAAQDYGGDHVRFLVDQLAQWKRDFPHDYTAALLRPPVDASKLSERAKGGAEEFAQSVVRLAALSGAKDVAANAEFRAQLEKTLAPLKEVNQAMASQRFPNVLQADWDQIRTLANGLARVYNLELLPVLEPPSGGRGGGGGRGPATAAAAPPGAIVGYIVDAECSKKGKGMWVNAECIKSCLRDGDKVVLVTEAGKVYTIANPDKISPESYGQAVTVTGKTVEDTITVESLKM